MSRAKYALLAVLLALPACAQQPPATPPARPQPGQASCTEPRPQVCTREYRPVCGTRRDGTRQTYGNGCTACGDRNVIRHLPGPCS